MAYGTLDSSCSRVATSEHRAFLFDNVCFSDVETQLNISKPIRHQANIWHTSYLTYLTQNIPSACHSVTYAFHQAILGRFTFFIPVVIVNAVKNQATQCRLIIENGVIKLRSGIHLVVQARLEITLQSHA